MRGRVHWLSAALVLSGCGPTAGGQSGSEFIRDSPDSKDDRPRDCPCGRFARVVPLDAEVVAWESSLLELEVKGTPIASLRERVPARGTRMLGVYRGELPCRRGSYVPKRGDRVLAYFFRASDPPLLCCDALRCPDACEAKHPDDLAAADACTAECQQHADAACRAETAGLEVAGYFELAPFDGEAAELARAGDRARHVAARELRLVYEGGEACSAELLDARTALTQDDDGDAGGAWQRSCRE